MTFISELMCACNFSMHGEHRLCALPTQTLAPDLGIIIAAVHQQHGLAGLKRLIKYFKFVIGNAETGEKGRKGSEPFTRSTPAILTNLTREFLFYHFSKSTISWRRPCVASPPDIINRFIIKVDIE